MEKASFNILMQIKIEKYNIEFIDFSVEGDLIMYMNSNDEVKVHNLINPKEQLQIDISSNIYKW